MFAQKRGKGITLEMYIRNTQVNKKNKKKECSTSLVIREMQIKTSLRFNLISVRMAKIRNSGDSTWW